MRLLIESDSKLLKRLAIGLHEDADANEDATQHPNADAADWYRDQAFQLERAAELLADIASDKLRLTETNETPERWRDILLHEYGNDCPICGRNVAVCKGHKP